MKRLRGGVVLLLMLAMVASLPTPSSACGPGTITPVFVFQSSPDIPFKEFVAGNIGIVHQGYGRKTLAIAYRYLNNHAFSGAEQQDLIAALYGQPPEGDGTDAVKAWVAARKDVLGEEEKPPEIYTERGYGGGYDFFPNCASNAFEVAKETLQARAASYGADDRNVRLWLATQDTVFQNCSGGTSIPVELGMESPEWLRKDREYQIGAALLYSLNFDGARARFEKTAADGLSPWQQTADYLVPRTLVRQASFAREPARKQQLYEDAENRLEVLMVKGGRFANASRKLLGLIKFRIHPKERVRELASVLDNESGNENLRQDLIDYVWLLDKFEMEVFKEEEEKRKAKEAAEKAPQPNPPVVNKEWQDKFDAVQNGQIIDLTLELKKPDGSSDYSKWIHKDFPFDTSEDEILQAFEIEMDRKLTPEEIAQLKEHRESALVYRKWRISPNQNWAYEDDAWGYGHETKLTTERVPGFLRTDDLTDWLFTFDSPDAGAYSHSFARWRATGSPAWLVAALTKSTPTSRGVEILMRAGEKIVRDAPAYPSVTYQLVRLQTSFGRKTQARKLLDDILSWQSVLPLSTQNQFLEQRMQLATTLSEFLKFAQRRPVAFYREGLLGKLPSFVEAEKGWWDSRDTQKTKEEYDQSIADYYSDLLAWDDRQTIEDETADMLNWHFSLELLSQVARDPALPDYLRRRFMLSVWTRAILLKNEAVARKAATDIVELAPELSPTFKPYLEARGDVAKKHAAIYILLKQPMLSPYVTGGLPETHTAEQLDYYFETSWWCRLPETAYDEQGNELPLVVAKPSFLTADQLATAAKERTALKSVGNGKTYLGELVLEWADQNPDDPLIPEALFIAAQANRQYKYGCDGWGYDEVKEAKLVELLSQNYTGTPWAAKLDESQK
ncbi:MAG TPA: hypothetical protein VLL54_03310 [Pyrinomonadaceae bacterium]|nr:hypothetical protein [Pyrinomonadaceae bacterium]